MPFGRHALLLMAESARKNYLEVPPGKFEVILSFIVFDRSRLFVDGDGDGIDSWADFDGRGLVCAFAVAYPTDIHQKHFNTNRQHGADDKLQPHLFCKAVLATNPLAALKKNRRPKLQHRTQRKLKRGRVPLLRRPKRSDAVRVVRAETSG